MKPGYKTTEFWLTLIANLAGAATASGAFSEGGLAAKIIGGVVMILATLGYTSQRTALKKGA